MRQLLHSFNDLSEKIGTVILLMFERVVLFVFGLFTLGGLITMGQNLPYINDPNNQEIIFFNEIKSSAGTLTDSEPIIRRTIDEGIGYLIISYSGDPNVYLIGNYDLVLPEVSYDLPFAAYGTKIKNSAIGNTLIVGDYARLEIPIADINQNAVFCAGRKIDLSDRILIAMSYDDYTNTFFHDDLVNFLHIVSPSKEQMQWIMAGLNPDELRVVPDSVANYRNTAFKNMFEGGLIFFALISFCTVFLCVHIFACEVEIINRKINEYYIHGVYGCGRHGVFMRIFFTLIQISMVPIIFILIFGRRLIAENISLLLIYAAIIIVFYIIVSKCFAAYVEKRIKNDKIS